MVAKLFFGRVEKRPSRKGEFVEDSRRDSKAV